MTKWIKALNTGFPPWLWVPHSLVLGNWSNQCYLGGNELLAKVGEYRYGYCLYHGSIKKNENCYEEWMLIQSAMIIPVLIKII